MKLATPFLCLLLLSGALVQADDVAPALSLQEAATIAQKALADKGADRKVFIQSISLFRSSLGSKDRWEVAWSGPIEGSKPHSVEVGLEISMSGDVVHLLRGPAEAKRIPSPH